MSTLILLDWDDTLFPTTWFEENRKRYIKLKELDTKLSQLFEILCKYGKVIVVTNASMRWFKETASYLSITKKYFDSKIEVISARDRHGRRCLHPSEWKRRAFQRAINSSDNFSTVVSIGDSSYEYDALRYISIESKRNIAFKYIRLMEDPDISTLMDQLQVLIDIFSSFNIKSLNPIKS